MTRTYRRLWSGIVSFEALHGAYLKARRGKRFRPEVLEFGAHLEEELLALRAELGSRTYRVGTYRRFYVHDPKTREVAALPFRDRVVQHALVGAIEPIWERRFIYDSYACRVGKGTHAGADRLTGFLRRAHRMWTQTYVLKGDVSGYFPSVDHGVLRGLLRRYVGCEGTLWLLDEVVGSWNADEGRGIPIGNLTSQLFANVYLHELDEFVKYDLRWKFYLRYMDDFVLLGADKAELNRVKAVITRFLQDRLYLRLNPKSSIFPDAQGVDFLGYRIWRTHRLLRKRSIRNMRRRLKAFAAGKIGMEEMRMSMMAWLGHARHANTYRLRKRMFGSITF